MPFDVPSTSFRPDTDHAVVSPETSAVVTAEQTQHGVSRKTVDTVLSAERETVVVAPGASQTFAPKTLHRVVFRPLC